MTTMLFRFAFALGLITACVSQERLPTIFPTPGNPVDPLPEEQKPATYWITYSKTVRPGHPMVFQAKIFKGSSPVDVSVNLKDVDGNVILSYGPVSVWPNALSSFSMDIPLDMKRPSNERWGWQEYTVEVFGRGQEMSFKEKGRASYQEKAFSIFVQTDKAMYKPSQKVQFRALVMTPDMKVMREAKMDIVVFDSKGNKILQLMQVQASQNLGVFEKSFKLASSVPTGDWKIQVTVEGVEELKEFEVSDYVLPKFEVEVDGLPYGINTALFYDFTVKATYTFGKPVTTGEVRVEISRKNGYYQDGQPPKWQTAGMLDENGELKIQVPVEKLRELGQSRYNQVLTIPSWWSFDIVANVTERRTGKTHSGKHSLTFYSTPISMEILDISPSSFKSGLDYTAYIEVKKRDGSLFSAEELKFMSVKIKVSYTVRTIQPTEQPITDNNEPKLEASLVRPGPGDYYPGHNTERLELTLANDVYQIPETGWVVVSFRVPDAASDLELQASTVSPFEEVSRTKWVSKSQSPTKSFLQLNVLNKKPRVGDTVTVQAKATSDMRLLNYQVFSKGMMVVANDVAGPSRSLSFQFVATKSMAPSMSIVAFYLRDDGEIVVDALSLSVEGLFDNSVKAEFSKKEVQPGESVNLVVKGESDSLVFLLVVDKSVKLLKSGNDITQEMVMEELSSYDYGNYGNWRYMFICGWPSYFGGEDAQSVFDNAGIVVMTDGLVYSRYNDNDYFLDDYYLQEMLPGAEADGDSGGSSPSRNPDLKPAESTRKNFPENWLWNIVPIE